MTKDRPALEPHETELSRSLSEFDITMIGVGAMIGAGIFVLTGIAAGTTGPSLMLAFALNGIVTIFTAMVYAELGSSIPEAGGGYLWVKDALGRNQSFLAGWMSWFSHAVAGALYALGFGSFAGELFARGGVDLPQLLGLGPEKYLGVLIGLIFLGINFRGASETGLAGNIVTIAKLAVIGAFVIAGIWAMIRQPQISARQFEPFFPRGFGQVFVAMGITFIAFEGYEIIVQAGEEVKNPKRAIPRAIFKSLLIVIPIYVLVAVTAIGAVRVAGDQATWQFLGEHGELGLAQAAANLLPFGTVIILVGGLLSTVSALNATTFSSTRVSFAMGRDHVLPDSFARIHKRFKTPYIALAATGLIILAMVTFVPIEDVAAAADVMFLLLFLQVNYAVIRIRGEFGDRLDYGYLMPLYPWVPIIGIITKAFLAVYLFQFSPLAWLFAGIWIAVGVGVFVAYARTRVESEDRPRVMFERKSAIRTGSGVLAAIGAPETTEPILNVATAAARARGSEVVALSVVQIPRTIPMSEGRRRTSEAEPNVRAIAEYTSTVNDIGINTVVGVGRVISTTITSIAEREESDLIVIGWRGTVHETRIRGSVAQELLRTAEQDVWVIGFGQEFGNPSEVVVGISPGLHAGDALVAGAQVAAGAGLPLRLLTVVRSESHDIDQLREELRESVEAAAAAGVPPERISTEVITSNSAIEAFKDRVEGTSLFVGGASRDWVFRRTLLGEFPDALRSQLPCPVLIVRPGEPRAQYWWEFVLGSLRKRDPGRERAIR